MTRLGHSEQLEVGDTVTVPGGMDGTVKFVGEVKGKPGIFVGVELSKRWASRGKNNGDAEGVRYFTTSIPGAGIFLPTNRASKRASPTPSSDSILQTPTTPSLEPFPVQIDNSTVTPPTPSTSAKFSQSLGHGRAPSPAFRPKSRPSLPRPESPLRRAQNTNATPAGRPSLNMLSHNRLAGPRFASSPTPNKAGHRSSRVHENVGYNGPTPGRANGRAYSAIDERDSPDEVSQLRSMISEKNEKIAVLTAEFDSHRSDFRSTLDTLETASNETERVYEKRIDDLLAENRLLTAQNEDVASIAHQLKGLEEVVAELEEGLEDARRGEAEARGEVEFLRGEVERVRAELKHERQEKYESGAGNKANGAGHGRRSLSPERHEEMEREHHTPVKSFATAADPVNGEGDADKWCALCEGDGHDSISCPFEKP